MSAHGGPEIVVEEKHLTQLVMGYLRERGHLEALACLHLESGLAEGEVGEELQYLQKLVLQGAWADVFVYLHPLRRVLGHNYEPIAALVKKQQVRPCVPAPQCLPCPPCPLCPPFPLDVRTVLIPSHNLDPPI